MARVKRPEVPQEDDFVIGDYACGKISSQGGERQNHRPELEKQPEERYVFKRDVSCPNCGATSGTLATKTEGQIQYRKCALCMKSFKQVGTLVKF